MTKKVLILGGQGMLGHRLFAVLAEQHEVHATFRNPAGAWQKFPMYRERAEQLHGGVDALNLAAVRQVLNEVRPDVVINCIGIIKQLRAAKDPTLSITVNALFPHQLADLCQLLGARMITLSTDCVFSGATGGYREEDNPDPVDLYGRTKLLGEVDRPGCLTLRTSIIGRDYIKNAGLIEWFLSQRGRAIKGYERAIYTGLTTHALSQIIQRLIVDQPDLSGIVQVASEPINKFDLLVQLRDIAQLDLEIAAETDFYCDRSLNGERFLATTGYAIPSWRSMLTDLAKDIKPYDDWRHENGYA